MATNGLAIAGRFPGGRPLRRRREMVLLPASGGCEGPQLQASIDHRCDEPMAIAGRIPGGRPLCRRREMVLMSAHRGCEAPQLQASTDHRCDEPMAIVGRCPGGRPLRRRRENGVVIGAPRLRGTASSRTPPIIVATNGWVIAGRFPRAKGGHFFAAFQCPCTVPFRSLGQIVEFHKIAKGAFRNGALSLSNPPLQLHCFQRRDLLDPVEYSSRFKILRWFGPLIES